jgi:hypothetical protein
MNDSLNRKNDKLNREDVFVVDNDADFSAGSPVALLTEEINVERQKILQLDADQTTGFADKRAAQENYEDARDRLVDMLDKFVLAASIVNDDIPGTAAKFKNSYPRTDQKLIARATSFHAESAGIDEQMKDAGLDAGDRALLLTTRDEFQQQAARHDSAEEHHAEATGGLIASFRKAMALSARRDKRIRMKYRSNPAKLAAWTVASHLDRAPKRKKEGGEGEGNNG